MQWLAPITGLIAAGVAVPLLVLMYFLKLKRTQQMVSSTLLWKRAVQDLQVNAPFQRLRRNLLLFLQLLALIAILIALARPLLSLSTGPGKHYVLLIDRSASMSATDLSGTSRLEEAKKRAKVRVESLRGRTSFSLQDTSDQAMVVAFDEHAKVMCNFTSDKRQLLAAIDAIEPTHAGSSLSEAIAVAQAFAQSPGEDANNRSAQSPAVLELFSDGRIADLGRAPTAGAEIKFHRVGETSRNVAVVAMQARRSYEKPEQVDVFATVANFGPAPVACDVQLSVDGNIRSVRPVTIPPRRKGAGQEPDRPGKVSISFALTHPGAGVVEVRHLHKDVLAADDTAWAVLQPPRKLRVLLVTGGSTALHAALKACPLARLDISTAAEFDAMDHDAMTVEQPYDVIVVDRCVPKKLPRGRYLIFGRPPQASGIKTDTEMKNQVVVDWRPRHPVLQFVALGELFAAKCWKLDLPRDAEVLGEFAECPALALVRREGREMLLASFDVMDTNWPFEPGFVMFCYNAMNFLGSEVAAGRQRALRVGQPIVLEGLPAGVEVVVSGPDVDDGELRTDAKGALRFPGTDHAGVYAVKVGELPVRPFAVNLLDAAESDIVPAEQIVLGGQAVEAEQGPPTPSNVELRPLLAALGLVVVCVEWFVYNSRVRL